MAAPLIGKLVIFGVGLIGGSFALALKRSAAVGDVVGIGRGRANLDVARAQGIADRTYTIDAAWHAELADADLVLLAAPVGQLPDLFSAIAARIGPRTVVTDAGSTKQDVIAAARAQLGSAFTRFVPGHPIAGTEQSGAMAAFDTLFRERNVVLTPVAETLPAAVARVDACWKACGGIISILEPARHDALFAAVSHLPHALAFALVAELAARPDAREYFRQAAGGFRDFTRLASSHPEMWRDICVANRVALRAELDAYRAQLSRIDRMLAEADGEALATMFAAARSARNTWIAGRDGGTEE